MAAVLPNRCPEATLLELEEEADDSASLLEIFQEAEWMLVSSKDDCQEESKVFSLPLCILVHMCTHTHNSHTNVHRQPPFSMLSPCIPQLRKQGLSDVKKFASILGTRYELS